ncbi:hypothetical protein L6452_31971 [Arctium lappa]|uniref:Uncharacterized protein n=1 Tax=Arctium lappa TaxID=4217 RepID=A0ACB8Z306_ARCLA|nr:hypothetical protein L6452_31971 [Arctium lappa]
MCRAHQVKPLINVLELHIRPWFPVSGSSELPPQDTTDPSVYSTSNECHNQSHKSPYPAHTGHHLKHRGLKSVKIVKRGLARDSARDSDRMSQSRRHNRRGSKTLGTSLAIVPCESDRVTIAVSLSPGLYRGWGCWRDYARESDKCHSRRVTIADKRFGYKKASRDFQSFLSGF